MYALVDCNSFYTSCEEIFRPDLRGKPIVVLSNNDGCIISRNAAAKALNIPGLAPFYQVKSMIEKNNVHIFSSNYELYGDISARVMTILEDYGSEIEVYSIDEAFLRVHSKDHKAHGATIKNAIMQQVGMPVCVGVAPTKTLSKLANHAAKKIKKLNGVCVLDNKDKWEWLLSRITTEEIWGIGSRISASLSALGINSGLELINSDAKTLRRHFSVVLEKTIMELQGKPCMDLELEPSPKKTIICSRSFSYKVTKQADLEQAICQYAASACSKLRKQGSLTSVFSIYVQYKKDGPLTTQQRTIKLSHPTNDARTISAQAAAAITDMFRPDVRYKKCGITLLELSTKKGEQLHFFTESQSQHSRNLMAIIDKIDRRYGRSTVNLANAGITPKWAMKRDYMSPAYTTRWRDIPVVRC